MKKIKKLIAIIFFAVFGILVGIQLNAAISGDYASPYKSEIEVQEVVELKQSTKDMKEEIATLKEKINELEEEKLADNIPLQNLKENVDKYKFIAGYSDVSGPGIIVTIDSMSGENIAGTIEGRRHLINLVNELKVFGAEVISINNNRLVARSEITLAGNHINVNGEPIPPPYVVKAIGDIDTFERYVEHGTILFELMASDGIDSSIDFVEDIKIPALEKEKPLEFSSVKKK